MIVGKGGHIRTVPIPQWAKQALDEWTTAAVIGDGKIFRAISRMARCGAMASRRMWSGTWSRVAARRRDWNGKGRDIGYALAARSCEEANSVEACTITALDAITAFAVPNPNHSSQNCRFFQVWLLDRLPYQADHPIYFGLANCCLSQPFRSSTVRKLNR